MKIIFQTFEIFLSLTITYFYNFPEDVLCHEFASLALVSMAGNYILHTVIWKWKLHLLIEVYYQYKLIAKVVTNLILFHSWVFLQSGDLWTRRPWGNCKASVISWLWCAGIYTEGTYFKDAPTIVVEFHPITAEHNSIKKLSIADVYLISHITWRRLTVCSLNVMIHIQSDHIMRQ